MSTDRNTDKQKEIYTYKRVLFSLQRSEILIHITTWMSPGNITLSEIRPTQKDEYYIVPFT
jgi:hypothetical protein